ATREEALEALEWLRAECAAIFADVAATVARVGVRDSALGAYAGLPEAEESSAKVRQAIEQPLVLQAAMREAASRAAGALPARGGSAEDLEAALQLFSQDPQVQKATGEIRAMHETCLGGGSVVAPRSQAWSADEALEVLRQLGRAKAERLGRLLHDAGAGGAPGAEGGPVLGGLAVRACAEAEGEVWARLGPGDRHRRCSFAVALEELSPGPETGGSSGRRAQPKNLWKPRYLFLASLHQKSETKAGPPRKASGAGQALLRVVLSICGTKGSGIRPRSATDAILEPALQVETGPGHRSHASRGVRTTCISAFHLGRSLGLFSYHLDATMSTVGVLRSAILLPRLTARALNATCSATPILTEMSTSLQPLPLGGRAELRRRRRAHPSLQLTRAGVKRHVAPEPIQRRRHLTSGQVLQRWDDRRTAVREGSAAHYGCQGGLGKIEPRLQLNYRKQSLKMARALCLAKFLRDRDAERAARGFLASVPVGCNIGGAVGDVYNGRARARMVAMAPARFRGSLLQSQRAGQAREGQVPMLAGAYVRQRSAAADAQGLAGSPRLGPALPPLAVARLLGALRAE
ncbi:unnamed protein product, partial [Prorocentrum cordatum]